MEEANNWILLICMMAGLTIGNFVGELISDVMPVLDFLNYGQKFGLENPIEMNLGFLILSFKIEIILSIMGIIGVALGAIVYKKNLGE